MIEGQLIGCGYGNSLNQIKTGAEHVHKKHDEKKKKKKKKKKLYYLFNK